MDNQSEVLSVVLVFGAERLTCGGYWPGVTLWWRKWARRGRVRLAREGARHSCQPPGIGDSGPAGGWAAPSSRAECACAGRSRGLCGELVFGRGGIALSDASNLTQLTLYPGWTGSSEIILLVLGPAHGSTEERNSDPIQFW